MVTSVLGVVTIYSKSQKTTDILIPVNLRRQQFIIRYKVFLFLEFSLIALHVHNVFTVIVERREQVPVSMAIEKMDSCTSVLSNTCAWLK